MTIADGLMILAVLLAPLIAVQVQKYLERGREKRARAIHIEPAVRPLAPRPWLLSAL